MTRASDPPPSDSAGEDPPADAQETSDPAHQTTGAEPRSTPSTAPAEHAAPSLVEWITQRDALAAAESAYAEAPAKLRELHRRARFALEIGDRASDPVDPYRLGRGEVFAIEAYRESVYWSLRVAAEADGDAGARPAPNEVGAMFATRRAQLEPLLADRSAERVAAVLARDFAADAEEPDATITADAAILRAAAIALSSRAAEPQARIDRLRRQRMRRSLLALFVTALLVIGLVSAARVALRKPNLAKNRAWRTSSTFVKCNPAKHDCGGTTTDIFFHTLEDPSPWIEFDLGVPTTFSSLSIKNRVDCCGDRAVPLVIEVSNDAAKWTEVARQQHDFETWQPSFAPQTARYVRLRVDRKSLLHLEQVAVHK